MEDRIALLISHFLAYSIGYFLWCFTWYFTEGRKAKEKPETWKNLNHYNLANTSHIGRPVRVYDAKGKEYIPCVECYVKEGRIRRYVTDQDGNLIKNSAGDAIADEWITVPAPLLVVEYKPSEEEIDRVFNDNQKKLMEMSKKITEACNGQPEKLTSAPKEPKLWKILSPKGQYICHVSALCATKALDRYAITDHIMRDGTRLMNAQALTNVGYRAVEDKLDSKDSEKLPPKESSRKFFRIYDSDDVWRTTLEAKDEKDAVKKYKENNKWDIPRGTPYYYAEEDKPTSPPPPPPSYNCRCSLPKEKQDEC